MTPHVQHGRHAGDSSIVTPSSSTSSSSMSRRSRLSSPAFTASFRRNTAPLALLAVVATAVLLVMTSSMPLVSAFYLPGVAPHEYQEGEPILVKVVKLDSVQTQLPYDYYSLPFCKPEKIVEASENLGEVLSGDQIETSPFQISMRQSLQCAVLCAVEYTPSELSEFASKIEDEYRVNMLLDNLPAVTKFYLVSTNDEAGAATAASMIATVDEAKKAGNKAMVEATTAKLSEAVSERYEKGYALGFMGDTTIQGTKPHVAYLNNHVRMTIKYHEDIHAFQGARIVGFEVEAFSIKHVAEGNFKVGVDPLEKLTLSTCKKEQNLQPLEVSPGASVASAGGGSDPSKPEGVDLSANADAVKTTVFWTYDVNWEPSDIRWASRWDVYLKMTDSKIHWFSIINSIMIVLFLSSMVAIIMARILKRDLARYNEEVSEEEQREETGWKLIHGDVFRSPERAEWLAVLVGSGTQVIAMTVITLVFASLGFVSPATRGSLMTALLFLFVLMGLLAGYASTRMIKMFEFNDLRSTPASFDWKRTTLTTALFFPGVTFGVFFVLNLFVWGQKSSGAVPFGTLVALLVLWLGISLPLVFLGSFIAYRQPASEHPVKTNAISRMLPPESTQPWYSQSVWAILIGGVLPFAAVFIEIFFIMSSIWLNQFYYMFGFLAIVFVVLLIACAEIAIVGCYFQLSSEDYHWWWRSFLAPGCSALYVFGYSFIYFFTKLHIVKFVSGLLFFGYMFLISLAFFLLTGTIGYYACLYFVTKIYASIKVE